ncbi:hypothetical protein NE865_01567 [Phthorimaea operculella]|nr:hypothetical protein NE865_01567 [Phthorimaea operculella]
MDNDSDEDRNFIFDIIKQVKFFYETPVIFLTKKDYSDVVFNTMVDIRKRFLGSTKENTSNMIDTIVEYHLEWLHAVNDLEQFKKLIESEGLAREDIYQSISYTIDAMNNRIKYLHRYMDTYSGSLSGVDQVHLRADLEIVEDMHHHVVTALSEELKCFRQFTDMQEFKVKVMAKVDDLLTWMDKIFDGLSMDLSKYIVAEGSTVPQLTGDMTKTLQQIVDELQTSKSDAAQKLLEQLKEKGKELSSMIRHTSTRELEMSKVLETISILDDRISRMEAEPSSAAVLALKHKKEFLEKRVESIEKLKTTIKHLNELSEINFDTIAEEEVCPCEDFFQLRIFNHLLPPEERERLVTELCYLWDLAVCGEKSHKSIISILSAERELKEEFTDDLGTFTIDENNRKIYKIPGDDKLYQTNEKNELVPLADDDEHIYYYDDCGRYYINRKTREKTYKAFASASEYVMDTAGVLLKTKEERDGITYFYNSFGRYYVNSEGKNIYRDEGSLSEYQHDGLGNLVRIRSQADKFEPCPEDVNVSEEFRYLKCAVGKALRVCIADVILHQPHDPIKYLSEGLVKFRENMEFREKKAAEEEALENEREVIRAEERAAAEKAALEAALLAHGGSEASYDSNLLNYSTLENEDSITASSPRPKV